MLLNYIEKCSCKALVLVVSNQVSSLTFERKAYILQNCLKMYAVAFIIYSGNWSVGSMASSPEARGKILFLEFLAQKCRNYISFRENILFSAHFWGAAGARKKWASQCRSQPITDKRFASNNGNLSVLVNLIPEGISLTAPSRACQGQADMW